MLRLCGSNVTCGRIVLTSIACCINKLLSVIIYVVLLNRATIYSRLLVVLYYTRLAVCVCVCVL